MGKQSLGCGLTTGVRFTIDWMVMDDLVDKFGTQEKAFEAYKKDFKEWIESSRNINVKSIEVSPTVGELFVVVETDLDTLREVGFNSLTKSAKSHWGYFLEKNDLETEGPTTVLNHFVSCDPDVNPEKQLLSA